MKLRRASLPALTLGLALAVLARSGSAQEADPVLHIGTEAEDDVITCREPVHAKMMAKAQQTSRQFARTDEKTVRWLIESGKCVAPQLSGFVPRRAVLLGPPHVLEASMADRRETIFVVTGASVMQGDAVIAAGQD
jgi:hypothetical protein